MNFTEVVAEVVSITKRPDKIADIRRNVNAAINFCCINTDFARDRQEQTVTIDSSAYAQSMAISDLTRFRKIDAIRPPASKKYLTLVEPGKIFQECVERINTYYIAGDSIVFKLSALSSTLLVAYYAYPPTLTDAAGTFWLLESSPYMIIDRAAASVFKNIGDDASYKTHMEDFKVAYAAAVQDFKNASNP